MAKQITNGFKDVSKLEDLFVQIQNFNREKNERVDDLGNRMRLLVFHYQETSKKVYQNDQPVPIENFAVSAFIKALNDDEQLVLHLISKYPDTLADAVSCSLNFLDMKRRFLPNKKRDVQCQLCNEIGHTALECRQYLCTLVANNNNQRGGDFTSDTSHHHPTANLNRSFQNQPPSNQNKQSSLMHINHNQMPQSSYNQPQKRYQKKPPIKNSNPNQPQHRQQPHHQMQSPRSNQNHHQIQKAQSMMPLPPPSMGYNNVPPPISYRSDKKQAGQKYYP